MIIIIILLLQATNENLPPNVIRQLAKELKNLDETPPKGIKVGVNDDDFTTIFADIDGPGVFSLSLSLSPGDECSEWVLLPCWYLLIRSVGSLWAFKDSILVS